ncbi:MAG: DUF3179 domain-containing protein [bacterium]|nr:DUF3179 domain-containing protein [bacterium]
MRAADGAFSRDMWFRRSRSALIAALALALPASTSAEVDGGGPVGGFDDSVGRRGGGGPGAGRASSFPSAGAQAPEHPTTRIRERLVRFLERQTGQRFGGDLRAWRRWYWDRPYRPHPDYALFKAVLYGQVDERMADFFPVDGKELIRLDEVDWGGVGVNGIPPLDHPKHMAAREADYLKDKHVVFGIEIGGRARAYPKRILAWHEMALDELGGVELAIVYRRWFPKPGGPISSGESFRF